MDQDHLGFGYSQLFSRWIRRIQNGANQILLILKRQKKILILLFLSLLAADFLVIKSYPYLLPKKELAPIKVISSLDRSAQNQDQILWEKNIFHGGPIPLKLGDAKAPSSEDPVKTSLSLVLKGTIVHANPALSVATVQDQTNETLSYKMGDLIGNQAKIQKIQRGKIIFFNENNNRLEYIVLPKDEKINISYDQLRDSVKPDPTVTQSIVKRNGNEFEINRSDVNSQMGQLHELLQQARVVPNRVERDGVSTIEGYTFAKIDKGSIYEDLGFKVGDIIKSVNGEMVYNPQKALELFEEFKTSSDVKVLVERNGREVEYNYGVNEDSPIN